MKIERKIIQKVAGVVLLILLTGALQGCFGAFQAMSSATNVFNAGRAGVSGYEAATTAKDLRETRPLFLGHDVIKIQVEIFPADQSQEASIRKAFIEEIVRSARAYAGALERPVTVCSEDCPSEGKTIIIHFREQGRTGMVMKVLAGDRLKGTTMIIDKENATPTANMNVSGEYYSVMAAMINEAILKGFLKEKEGDPKLSEYVERVNAIPLISTEGERVLKVR